MARIRFISIETLLEMKANKENFKLIEVLKEDNYKKGHIPGAINIPLDKLEQESSRLKKEDTTIVYCSGYSCTASTKAAELLMKMGFKNVLDFKGGKDAWKNAGLEMEL